MYKEPKHRSPLPKLIALCGLLIFFILGINAVRVLQKEMVQPPIPNLAVKQPEQRPTISKPTTNRPAVQDIISNSERRQLPKSVLSKERLYSKYWPKGFSLYRYRWTRNATLFVAEMDRNADNLRFDVELSNSQILRRETVTSATRRLKSKGIKTHAGVNGSFGIREDSYGRGGMIFNLHIQNGELVSIPILLDRWGFSPPSPWGETSFGVTPDGEFLLDAVKLNGTITIGNQKLRIDAINQICDSYCPAVLYTPRFGRTTLTRRCYEFTLQKLTLPLTGKYASRFVVTSVNPRGNSVIPSDAVVLAIAPGLGRSWYQRLKQQTNGTLEIALTPEKWQTVQTGIGGNLRILRNGKIEPELVDFYNSRGRSAYSHSNASQRHPRSALGFSDDKLFLIVVDGRRPGHSMGMTLYEMADFFSDIGIKHAINFDGGSSSALWALGDIVNRPAHDYERPIFNVALIREK